jgi:hypothetical protein
MEVINKHFFSALLHHETSWFRESGKRGMSRQWRMIYTIFFAAVALILTTYFSRSFHLELKYIWNVCWGIPWIVFGISIGKIKREWGNGTVDWWLSLPYSRWKLIAAKFMAMLIRGTGIALLIFVLIILFGAYATLISSNLSFHDFLTFIRSGWLPMLLDLAAFPLMSSLGLTLGVLHQSIWRPAGILFWICWGILWSLGSATGWLVPLYKGDYVLSGVTAAVAVSWLICGLFLYLSAWLLENKLDL